MADTGDILTYADLEERSLRSAHFLRDAGLKQGDCIAVLAENTPRYFEIYWAAMRCGLFTALNVYFALDEHLHVSDDSGAKAIFVSATKAEFDARIAEQRPDLTLHASIGGQIPGYSDLDEPLAGASTEPLADQPAGQDMLYSSGTTVKPRNSCLLPDRQVNEPGHPLIAVFGSRYGLSGRQCLLFACPAVSRSAAAVLCDDPSSRWNRRPSTQVRRQGCAGRDREHRVTHSQWVPTMFVRMLKLPREVRERYDTSSMRVAIHAAAPRPVEVKQEMSRWWGPVFEEHYSATETHGITMLDSHEWLVRLGSVGKTSLGILRVCDDSRPNHPEVDSGQARLVYFERDTIPFAYHNDPEKTLQVQHPQHPNWATTGNIGWVDADGYLYLTDRRAFVITSGGANIHPQEAENVLTLHPAVLDVGVVGVPDADMSEAVKAVVQLETGFVPSPELERELIDYVRERIAKYKALTSVDFAQDLPQTPTGKLVKGKIKERYLTQASAD
ncbi:acyl-CoA synthetase [Rhodococcus baikonurensis]